MPRPLIQVLRVATALLVLAFASGAALAKPKYTKTEEKEAGGTHWRIKTEKGPIHVWVPKGYHRDTAGLVVYVHGYHTNADAAWKNYKLASQFSKSRQNAMFVVPEAPRSNDHAVKWTSMVELKRAVTRANFRLPDGAPIVIGHSGAFRTISHWLDNRFLAEVILLDALYGREKDFEDFIHGGERAKHHKLIVVATSTKAKSQKFAKQFRYAAVRDRIPDSYDKFTTREKKSKLLYMRSQYGHMALVTNGKVIPLLLRLTPLKRL